MKSSATRAICTIASCIAIAILASARADAKVFRWSFQGDVLSLDPQDRRDTFSRDFAGNIMEPLVKFNEKLEIEPALAERWEIVEPTLWRFHLRKGVKFSNGNVFNADDVIFTFQRGAAPVSPFRGILRAVKEVRRIDDHTVDFVLNTPYPILDRDLSNMHIYDREWVEANNASAPVELVQGKAKPSYLASHILGTGPFALKSYEPDAKIVLEPNPLWWGRPKHNLTEVVFTPIKSGATRIAALLSGQVDMIFPVPPQDVARIEQTAGTNSPGARAADRLHRHGPGPRRASRVERQRQKSIQGYSCSPRGQHGDRCRSHSTEGHGWAIHAQWLDDRAQHQRLRCGNRQACAVRPGGCQEAHGRGRLR